MILMLSETAIQHANFHSMDGPEFIDSELHRSAAAGEASDVRDQILNEGVDVNIKGAGERRPLHRAAGNGHYSASKVGLE